MLNRLTRGLVVGGAATAAVAVVMTSALAATPTFTVSAGKAPSGKVITVTGTTTGTSPQVTFVDTTSSTTLTCASSKVTGTTTIGTGRSGTDIANIPGASSVFTNCTGPFGLTFTVKGQNTWKLNAVRGNATSAGGNIGSVHATVTDGSVCAFTVTGAVPSVSYADSTQVLTSPGTSSGLTISGVPSGECFGVINNGDKASYKAKYLLKANTASYNPVKITSP